MAKQASKQKKKKKEEKKKIVGTVTAGCLRVVRGREVPPLTQTVSSHFPLAVEILHLRGVCTMVEAGTLADEQATGAADVTGTAEPGSNLAPVTPAAENKDPTAALLKVQDYIHVTANRPWSVSLTLSLSTSKWNDCESPGVSAGLWTVRRNKKDGRRIEFLYIILS